MGSVDWVKDSKVSALWKGGSKRCEDITEDEQIDPTHDVRSCSAWHLPF